MNCLDEYGHSAVGYMFKNYRWATEEIQNIIDLLQLHGGLLVKGRSTTFYFDLYCEDWHEVMIDYLKSNLQESEYIAKKIFCSFFIYYCICLFSLWTNAGYRMLLTYNNFNHYDLGNAIFSGKCDCLFWTDGTMTFILYLFHFHITYAWQYSSYYI